MYIVHILYIIYIVHILHISYIYYIYNIKKWSNVLHDAERKLVKLLLDETIGKVNTTTIGK